MKGELKKELELRGIAEISNGVVNQVTKALDETDNEVDYLIFGERKKQSIIPIDEACAKCDFWRGKFDSTKKCQESQKRPSCNLPLQRVPKGSILSFNERGSL